MIFNLYTYLYIFTMFFVLNSVSQEMIFIIWYFMALLFFIKMNSHISFMLLSMELMSSISLTLVAVLMLKSMIEVSFFFLFVCLLVGEACLGLSLLVMSSRFQKKELVSLSIV